jgi:carbon-monoxide dehydrogenase medium subunit
MKPAPFRYLAPRSLDEALALKAEHGGDAMFLAGGQSLVPAMNFRLAQPAALIDLNTVAGLEYVRPDGATLRIGALARNAFIEHDPTIAARHPLVAEAMPHVAHPQIRNRGTLCGNLAHADPASEMPAVMLALGARFRARSKRGERWIDAPAFFEGVFTTALAEDEMLAEVALPELPPRTGTSFLEVARRKGDYAMMGVAAVVTLDAAGRCTEARLAFCNAGATPMAAIEAPAGLKGHAPSPDAIRAAASAVRGELDPAGNVHATKAYQLHLADVLARRALAAAAARAGGAQA